MASPERCKIQIMEELRGVWDPGGGIGCLEELRGVWDPGGGLGCLEELRGAWDPGGGLGRLEELRGVQTREEGWGAWRVCQGGGLGRLEGVSGAWDLGEGGCCAVGGDRGGAAPGRAVSVSDVDCRWSGADTS